MPDNKRTSIHRSTGRIALSGVIAGLAVAVMLASAILPSMTYALPMVAGALLVIPAIEFGSGTALSAYAAISILAFILPADKEAALMFVLLFGLYPIIKKFFEQIKLRPLEIFFKFLYFNAAAVGAVSLAFFIFGVPITDSRLGKWTVPLLLIAGNICFLIYDVTLTQYITLYVRRLQPILRKTFHL